MHPDLVGTGLEFQPGRDLNRHAIVHTAPARQQGKDLVLIAESGPEVARLTRRLFKPVDQIRHLMDDDKLLFGVLVGLVQIRHLLVLIIRIQHFAGELFLGEFGDVFVHTLLHRRGGADLGHADHKATLTLALLDGRHTAVGRQHCVGVHVEHEVLGLCRAAGVQREADGVGGFLRQQGGVPAGDHGDAVRLGDGCLYCSAVHRHSDARGIDLRVAVILDLDFKAKRIAGKHRLQRHVHFRVLT